MRAYCKDGDTYLIAPTSELFKEARSGALPKPRHKKDPERMTAEEELRSLLKWAEQQRFENVAAALRRILTKLLSQKRSNLRG